MSEMTNANVQDLAGGTQDSQRPLRKNVDEGQDQRPRPVPRTDPHPARACPALRRHVSNHRPRFQPLLLALVALFVGHLQSGAFAQAKKPQQPAQPNAKTCEKYTLLGKLYYTNNQLDAAYVAFRQCVTLEPDNTEALYNLGRVEIKLRLYSPAIEHFKKAIGIDSKFVSAYLGLSQAYSRQFVDSKDRTTVKSQLDEALRVLDDAERVATTNIQKSAVYNERGTIYKYKAENDKALEAYKKALGFAPDNATVLFNLGALQMQSGKYGDSIDSMRKAVDLEPKNAQNRAFLAKALRLNKDEKTALSEATQAYNLAGGARGKDAFVIGQYGITQYANKNMTAAKSALELAVKVDEGTYHENYYYLGRVYLETSQARDARAQLSKAAFIEPSEPLYWYWLGQANEASSLKEDACKSYAAALKAKPGYPDAQTAASALKCPAAPSAR
jgi:tetratricopeptide (TPR) repeat protein